MTNRLLASALIAAQLLTYTSGGFYVCVASDGTVAVDGGPAACHRCHSQCADHKKRDHVSACCHKQHDASPADDSAMLAAPACDCQHTLISQSESTILTRQNSANDECHALAWVAHVPVQTMLIFAERVELGVSSAPSSESPHLRALSSTILRC